MAPLAVAKAIAQVNSKITVVRIAVATFELTPATPTFAKMAVNAAKTAESNAQVNQFIRGIVSASRVPKAFVRVKKHPLRHACGGDPRRLLTTHRNVTWAMEAVFRLEHLNPYTDNRA
jgi:hypothetical protein